MEKNQFWNINKSFGVSTLNIMPTYECDMRCGHCLFSACRKKHVGTISTSVLQRRLVNLRREGVRDDCIIDWYGGEVSLLGAKYIKDRIDDSRNVFTKSVHSVVSNLINVKKEWITDIASHISSICTSYDEFRFRDENDFNQWRKNVYHASRLMPIHVIVTATKNTDRHFKAVDRLPFTHVSVAPLKIPEFLPVNQQEMLLNNYCLSVNEYVGLVKDAVDVFGRHRVAQLQVEYIGSSICNVLHIFPDGNIGLPVPSPKGFPFEGRVIFPATGTVNSLARMKFLLQQSNACISNDKKEGSPQKVCQKLCISEFKYPGICTGGL